MFYIVLRVLRFVSRKLYDIRVKHCRDKIRIEGQRKQLEQQYKGFPEEEDLEGHGTF